MTDKIRNIEMLILDVDGVMTDGRIIYDANGVESKFFNVKDGHGIKLLQRSGVQIAIISGRDSQVAKNRGIELGIEHIYLHSTDKLETFCELLESTGFKPSQTAFIGDDLIDIPVLKRVGFSAAPADAIQEVRSIVDFVTINRGGWGAVREVTDRILKGKGVWDDVISRYYR